MGRKFHFMGLTAFVLVLTVGKAERVFHPASWQSVMLHIILGRDACLQLLLSYNIQDAKLFFKLRSLSNN